MRLELLEAMLTYRLRCHQCLVRVYREETHDHSSLSKPRQRLVEPEKPSQYRLPVRLS